MAGSDDMAHVAAPHVTTSGKIRALAAAGHSRADIARFLGKRYQHVRNVLTEDERLGRSHRDPPPAKMHSPAAGSARGVQEAPRAWPETSLTGQGLLRLTIDASGAIQLPPQVEEALALHRGGVVVAELRGDQLVLFSTAESLRRAQELVRALIPGSDSLADSLIAERRPEAASEADD